MTAHRQLIAEVKKQKYLRELTYEDIAKMAGYSPSSIKAFMAGVRQSQKLAEAIAKALNISY